MAIKLHDYYLAVVLVTVFTLLGLFLGEVEGRKCVGDSCPQYIATAPAGSTGGGGKVTKGSGGGGGNITKGSGGGNITKGSGGGNITKGSGGGGGNVTKSANGTRIADIVTDDFFNGIADKCPSDCAGKGFYTREAFLEAVTFFPQFGKGDSLDDTKREIAALFAHFSHETGDFCYTEEIDGASQNYCDNSDKENPCVEDKEYYGRGPIQLTWNFNYGPAGEELGFDGLNDPDIVAKDPVISFKTGLRFWMDNCHSLVSSGKGFGETIRAVNGDLECNGANPTSVGARAMYFTQFCKTLGTEPGDKVRC